MTTHRGGPGKREAHHQWKGQEAGYQAATARVRALRGKAATHPCSSCGAPAFRWVLSPDAEDTKVDQQGRVFSLVESSYIALCARCHRIGKNA